MPHSPRRFVAWVSVLAAAGLLTSAVGVLSATTAEAAVEQSLAVDLAVGNGHTCAVTDGGALKCVGDNTFGQLGQGTPRPAYRVPKTVPGLESGVRQVVAGGRFTCVLLDDGTVDCWGDNQGWIAGTGDGVSSSVERSPVTVNGLPDDIATLVAGQHHVCALTAAGGVLCWGSNTFGQLGIGNSDVYSAIPTTPIGLSSDVTSITAGFWHTCASLTDGSVKCWGNNDNGQLGDIGDDFDHNQPVTAAGMPDGITQMAAGLRNTCVLTDQGEVWCWGSNAEGELGDDKAESSSLSPIQVPGLSDVTGIGVAATSVCAVPADGSLKCWGSNIYGVLGDGTFDQRPHPVDVVGLDAPVVQVATGWSHTCARTEAEGIRCWGTNRRFALGVKHPKHPRLTATTLRGFIGTDGLPT